jgi:hypothetical protein
MNAFRDILYAHLDGQVALEQVERVLEESLQQHASYAPAHGAIIEALYRGERLPGDAYHVLMRCVQEFQRPGALAPAPSVGGSDDRTILRDARAGVRPLSRPAIEGSSVATGSVDDPDKTRFRLATRPAGTPVSGVSEPSVSGAGRNAERDMSTDERRNTGTTGTTGTSWSDPSRWPAAEGPVPGPGSVMRDRFVLEEPLGKGGMGTVYRARDLRKEEAQDRNPYVAIKILNEDFKRHPRSLQALQREARKSQTLAHPNIVTVYDFDRDGANVYMVMELLAGEPLDVLIRRHEGVGLAQEEAWRIGCELCTGMAYAHQNGFVHADFKPANAFLLQTGAVKIIDFGIARAVKRGVQSDGTLTVFDPGTLGALTPAYASCEVNEGDEPDASDDVYAISCVVYELLTGTHPFLRVSADVARSSNAPLVPPPGLSRRRWHALRRGLEFRRADRPASAAELLESFVAKPFARWTLASAVAAGVAVLVVGVMLIRGHTLDAHQQALIETLATAKGAQVEAALPDLRELSPGRRATVLFDARARAGLIGYFSASIDAALDAQQGHYDYPRATKLLAQLGTYLPDSQTVRDLTDRITARKNEEIRRQSDVLDIYIARGPLIDAQAAPNALSVLATLRSIDPESRLLHDPRLPGAFAEQTRVALAAGDPMLATALVNAGLEFDPRHPTLVDLRDRVRNARVAAQATSAQPDAASAGTAVSSAGAAVGQGPQPASQSDADLRAHIAVGLAQPDLPLADARALVAMIDELGRRGAEDGPDMKKQLKIRLAQQIAAIRNQSGIDPAIRYAEGAYAMFPGSPVLKRTLIGVRVAEAQRAAQRREGTITEVRRHLDALLDSRRVDDQWPAAVESDYKWLDAYLADDDPYMIQVKRTMATLYLGRATSLREAQRVTEATRMIERARQLGGESATLAGEEKLLTAARASQEADARTRERAAQLSARKEKLLVQAQANEVGEAFETLRALRTELPRNDAFIEDEGPLAIARAFVRMASAAARDGRFDDAVTLVGRGRELARLSRELGDAKQRYTRYRVIDEALRKRSDFDTRGIRRELTSFAKREPEEVSAVTRRWVRNLSARVTTAPDARTAERLTQAARDLGEQEVEAVGAEAAAAAARDASGPDALSGHK